MCVSLSLEKKPTVDQDIEFVSLILIDEHLADGRYRWVLCSVSCYSFELTDCIKHEKVFYHSYSFQNVQRSKMVSFDWING